MRMEHQLRPRRRSGREIEKQGIVDRVSRQVVNSLDAWSLLELHPTYSIRPQDHLRPKVPQSLGNFASERVTPT